MAPLSRVLIEGMGSNVLAVDELEAIEVATVTILANTTAGRPLAFVAMEREDVERLHATLGFMLQAWADVRDERAKNGRLSDYGAPSP